jgi:phosphohistidine phosphatase SixA
MWPRFILAVALACALAPAAAQQARGAKPGSPSAETIRALKRGGYVLYMRHGASDTSKPDRSDKVDFGDCSTQRPLTDEGRRQAAEIGKSMRALEIPIGEVLASPYCRAKETAELAFGHAYIVDRSLMSTTNLPAQEKEPLLAALRSWLGKPVAEGTNRVLISHNAPLMDAVGIYPKPEGVILVFRPDGRGGFSHIATIVPGDWPRLVSPSHR